MSVGLEEAEDLIGDLDTALKVFYNIHLHSPPKLGGGGDVPSSSPLINQRFLVYLHNIEVVIFLVVGIIAYGK